MFHFIELFFKIIKWTRIGTLYKWVSVYSAEWLRSPSLIREGLGLAPGAGGLIQPSILSRCVKWQAVSIQSSTTVEEGVVTRLKSFHLGGSMRVADWQVGPIQCDSMRMQAWAWRFEAELRRHKCRFSTHIANIITVVHSLSPQDQGN